LGRINRKIKRRDFKLILSLHRIWGENHSVIANIYGYTVSQCNDFVKNSISSNVGRNKSKEYIRRFIMSKKNLDSLLSELVEENTKALALMAKQVQDPDWLSQQTGQNIGVLYDKISNINIRLLEAAGQAQRLIEEQHEQRDR